MDNLATISKATVRRIPIYYRAALQLQADGIERIRSHRLAELIQVPSATIRRDFSNFGELGRSGYGYSVDTLVETFAALLEVAEPETIVLVGVGGIGQALLANNFRRNPDLNIVCAFDVDKERIGQTIGGVTVEDFKNISKSCPKTIHTAIAAVPSAAQATVVPALEAIGINAIMTFAPLPVASQPTTTIRYIDLTSELQSLLFTARHSQKSVDA